LTEYKFGCWLTQVAVGAPKNIANAERALRIQGAEFSPPNIAITANVLGELRHQLLAATANGGSKTDQESAGREVGLPFGTSQDTCPVRSLRQWLATSGISDGPVFRSVGRYGHVAPRSLHKNSIWGLWCKFVEGSSFSWRLYFRSSREYSIPECRRSLMFEAAGTEGELSFVNTTKQFHSGNGDCSR
jgi:hypothetical protein